MTSAWKLLSETSLTAPATLGSFVVRVDS